MSQFFDVVARKDALGSRLAGSVEGENAIKRSIVRDCIQMLGLPQAQRIRGKRMVDVPVDPADIQLFRELVDNAGGFEPFAIGMIGEENFALVKEHFEEIADQEDIDVFSIKDLILGKREQVEMPAGPSAAFKAVFETSVARKEYVQTVDGREVRGYEADTDDAPSNRVVIPYVRNKAGVVMTQAHYKTALGIPMDPKNAEYDRRPVLQIYITREGGSEVKLAVPMLIKLRQEYDEALQVAREALDKAKANGSFDPNVKMYFTAASEKKLPWEILNNALRLFREQVITDAKPITLDTGFGPWPCQGVSYKDKRGEFVLAIRILKDDMTDRAKEARAAHVTQWREEQKAKAVQAMIDRAGYIPLI